MFRALHGMAPGDLHASGLGDLHASGLIVGLNCRSPDQKHPVKINILLLLLPAYVSTLITPYQPRRALRSAGSAQLCVPRHNMERYGRRSFSCAGPQAVELAARGHALGGLTLF